MGRSRERTSQAAHGYDGVVDWPFLVVCLMCVSTVAVAGRRFSGLTKASVTGHRLVRCAEQREVCARSA